MTTYKLVMPEDMNHYGFLFGGKMLMWIDEVDEVAGVAAFAELAKKSNNTLFI